MSDFRSQISCKISDFEYPLSMVNGLMYYKERHLLLSGCFKPFLRCMSVITRASHDIYKPPHMVHTMSFLPKRTIKFHAKYQI